MKKILVSACLLGYNCRYLGDNRLSEKVVALSKDNILIPVCPEQLGGLPTPRFPAERINDKVVNSRGADVTEEYLRGAKLTLEIAKANGVDYCVLKAQSPSCGAGIIYDGTFTGNKIKGDGITAELLKENGFKVVTENDL